MNMETEVYEKREYFLHTIKLLNNFNDEGKVTPSNVNLMIRAMLGEETHSFCPSVRTHTAAVHHFLGFTLWKTNIILKSSLSLLSAHSWNIYLDIRFQPCVPKTGLSSPLCTLAWFLTEKNAWNSLPSEARQSSNTEPHISHKSASFLLWAQPIWGERSARSASPASFTLSHLQAAQLLHTNFIFI